MNQIQQEQYTGKGGIYSTRKLELACRKNIDFIWFLQEEKVPDYSSFARFRSGKAKDAVEDLFYQFVQRLLLCLAFDLQKFFSKLQRGKRKSHLFPLKKE